MNNLDILMQDINKKYKDDIVVKGTNLIYVDRIPFSSPRANYLTYGGMPAGKAVEFFGPDGSGKTTTALDIVAQAQKKAVREYNTQVEEWEAELNMLIEKNNKTDKKKIKKLEEELEELKDKGPKQCVYVDAENTLDEAWARLNGVDTDSLYLVRPQTQTAEQILQMILDVVSTGNVSVVVLDSIPMLVPQQIFEESMEKKSYAGVSGPMAIFSSKVPSLLNKYRTLLIMINQVRDDLKNPYNLYSTPGGRALKHLYAVRMLFRKGTFIDKDNKELNSRAEEPAGNLVMMDVAKTKVFKPDRRVGFYTLSYTNGIDVLADTVDLGIKYDLIHQAGSWYTLVDNETGEIMQDDNEEDLKFQGKASLLEFLRDNDFIFTEIYDKIYNTIRQ